ncbi:MAG: pyrimidine-nucleoside phosphorylase [Clostridia bacterium]|nr:pyrimidine-nucleoside phosphorylase [Clostridia bacterium]
MRAVDMILKKRDGEFLQEKEIHRFIEYYIKGMIPDYQMSAMCMAIYFKGMNSKEVSSLTMAMANSGDTVDLSPISGIKIDKHSTGGVADTTTLIVGPLVAAAGVPFAKMSGRSLGYTGGTIDKLESIPGFQTSINQEQFIKQVNEINLAIIGQSKNLAPADKKLYAIRDVTGTVSSIPLIASSIMSKKIAGGANKLLLDVKTGNGAFMKNKEDAYELAKTMVTIGQEVNKETIAIVTNMDQPLGTAVGNSLEVEEAILTLQGKTKGPLRELCLYLGAHMLVLADKVKDIDEGIPLLNNLLESGAALKKLEEMINAQGGNGEVVKNTSLLPQAVGKHQVKVRQDGYINFVDAEALGFAAMILGAGREYKDSKIDLSVGIKIHVKREDKVKAGQTLLTIHYNDKVKLEGALKIIPKVFQFANYEVEPEPLVYGMVSQRGRFTLNLKL